MKKYIFLGTLIVVFFLVTVQNSISVPKKNNQPTFSDVTVTSSNSHLLLFGMLDNSFTKDMIQGLHSGLPIHFSFFIEMTQTEKGWKDGHLLAMETHHVVSYDTLKETYKVEIAESGKRFFSFEKLIEAQSVANEINGLKITKLESLLKDTSYTVRIRAELYKKRLPMGLHEVVPFVSLWDLNTKWFSVTFKL